MIRRIKSFVSHGLDTTLSLLPMSDIERAVNLKVARTPEFTFNGHRLKYFFHSYNNFGITERAIEIPIIKHYLEHGRYSNVLEIGNVTNHYYDYFREAFARKTIVDKFERAYDVVNADIREFSPEAKFDFVFSISTFEHMDSDLGRNPDYVKGSSKLITVAADNIKHVGDTMVKHGGKFVITAPLTYTPEWRETFCSGVLAECGFSRHQRYLFRRVDELRWEQIDVEDAKDAVADSYLPFRLYLSIVELDK